jgi:hypothetical protein
VVAEVVLVTVLPRCSDVDVAMTSGLIQLDLFAPAPPVEPEAFTAADLGEWIAHVETCTYDTGHWPNEWARDGLAALLGEPVPHGRRVTKELLALLRRAEATP